MSAITRRVNRLLDSHSISEEDLREVVEQYEGELSIVNQKLGDAVDLVRRGLRSEAMAIIGSSPSLIDQANELSIPRLDELMELTELYDLPPISVVDTEAIEVLGDAMVELQSIDGLLKRQRKLVLARAPLVWRLRTLRAIAEADPTSPHWIDDIDAHEKARLKELSADVQQAVRSDDLAKLMLLKRELADTWQTAPPPSLQTAVNRHIHQLRLAGKQEDLIAAAAAIQESMDQFDEARTRQAAALYTTLRDEIVEQFGPSSVAAEAEVIASPGLEYVAELNAEQQRVAARHSAIAKLENTMDRSGVTVPQIESAYQKAITFDEPLPPELFNRYRATIDDLKTRGKRKFQLAVGAVAVATLLLIGFLVTWQIRRGYAEKVATVSGQLRRILDSGALDEASQFIEAVRRSQPKLVSDPKVAELVVLHQSMMQSEEDRAARFDQQISELEAIDDEALEPSTLSRLEEEATTDDEKLRVLKQRDRYARFVDGRRKNHTESLISALRETGDILPQHSQAQLAKFELDDLRSQAAKLNELTVSIKHSLADFPYASLSAKQEGDNQIQRIAALKTRMHEQEVLLIRSAKALEDLLAARSLSNLKSRMENYISELSVDRRSAGFRQTLDSAEFWETADLWNLHIRRVQEIFSKQFQRELISNATQSGGELSEVCVTPPFDIPASLRACIDQAERRQSILDQFERFLDQSLFSQIISVTQRGGQGERVYIYKNFYDSEREKFSIGENQPLLSRVEVVQTGDGAIEQETLSTPLVIELEPAASVVTLKAKWKAARADALADWDGEMLKWLANLCRREKLDSTIKEILLAQAIEKIMEGSAARDQFAKVHHALVARQADWEDWHRPAARSVRPTDLVVQKIMPALSALYQAHRDPRQEAKRLAHMRIRPVGIWDIVGGSKLSSPASTRVVHYWEPTESLGSGILMVVRRDSADPLKCRWIPFGTFESGQMKVTDSSIAMTAGEPIFLSSGTATPVAINLPSHQHSLVSVSP
ncbi:hypothetical protein [Aporhodopirellula aestuarii]|uniref:Uncharacterized protein n=1 Tax=Aporhodopirellula aestuarii TaxID=2950107 RepID=A0ABT0U4Z5_9BACT|nr:hypothetical protein [Aporhodopirellula aestuarii]MCM2371867.1 hypothetical protein [Aporhodopirellula aestuarii]